jgi:hypothetical protein
MLVRASADYSYTSSVVISLNEPKEVSPGSFANCKEIYYSMRFGSCNFRRCVCLNHYWINVLNFTSGISCRINSLPLSGCRINCKSWTWQMDQIGRSEGVAQPYLYLHLTDVKEHPSLFPICICLWTLSVIFMKATNQVCEVYVYFVMNSCSWWCWVMVFFNETCITRNIRYNFCSICLIRLQTLFILWG